jgi:hypothetical protein
VANPETEDESTRPGFRQGTSTRRHCHRITRPNIGNAGSDYQSRSRTQVDRRLDERLSPTRLPKPESAKAQLLNLAGDLPLHGCRLSGKGAGKDAHTTWPYAAESSQTHLRRLEFSVALPFNF